MTRTLTTALAATALVLLAGCGDDDAAEPDASATATDADLTVIAEDVDFGADSYEAQAGEIGVSYVNEGMIEHSLVVEDVDGFRLLVESTGDVDEGTVELEAGSYTLICDIPGHAQAGMVADLEVS